MQPRRQTKRVKKTSGKIRKYFRAKLGGTMRGKTVRVVLPTAALALGLGFFGAKNRQPGQPQRPPITSPAPSPTAAQIREAQIERGKAAAKKQLIERPLREKNAREFAKNAKLSVMTSKGSVLLARGATAVDTRAIDSSLQAANSPAAGQGAAFVKYAKQYGICPEFALGVFWAESNYGTKGIAKQTKSPSNMRYTPPQPNGVQYSNYKGFRQYATWEDGIKDFFRLVKEKYVDSNNLSTLDQIIARYSPASENDTRQHIFNIRNRMNQLRNEHNKIVEKIARQIVDKAGL